MSRRHKGSPPAPNSLIHTTSRATHHLRVPFIAFVARAAWRHADPYGPKAAALSSGVRDGPALHCAVRSYHINSLSFSPDGETFLSADDLRINLWSLNNSMSTFNIVDIKPDDMEELSEVITSAEFHPTAASQLVYSSSKGLVRLCDLRESARVERNSGRTFGHAPQSESERTFFSEVIASMSDVKFSRDGRYLMARDYMTLKIWDVNQTSAPLRTIKVHEQLRSKLCELYESDCIFDKFECSWGCTPRPCATLRSESVSFAVTPAHNHCAITSFIPLCVLPAKICAARTASTCSPAQRDRHARILRIRSLRTRALRSIPAVGTTGTCARVRTTISCCCGTRLGRATAPRLRA